MKKSKFGKAFPDQFKKVAFKYGHFQRIKSTGADWQDGLISPLSDEAETPVISEWRKLTFLLFAIVLFSVFFFRLFHLQIVEGAKNRELADSNRIQIKVIHATRGVIYDRNGKILAQNEPGFRLLESTNSATKAKYISRDDALKMEISNDPNLKNLEVDSIRSYPMGEKTAHILGYVGEINEDELKEPQYEHYKLGDKIGRSGVEENYEDVLKGKDGGEVIEVDSAGKKIRSLNITEPIPGQNLILSIDADLQNLAYNQLADAVKKNNSCCGAVVVQNPGTGEILAMASYPSFNPADISPSLIAPNSPILNRAIGGVYPPGSTFKVATSLAGLTSGKVNAQTRFEDTGVMSLGQFTFANWYFTEYGKKEEGGVDILKALQRSNDIYFYNLGQLTGEQVLADTAKKLGMGEKLGIDIPGESVGLIPDNAWKEKNIGDVWYPGDTLHMSIGQGYVLVTPLQISNLISTVAASGKQFPPHLAIKITDPQNRPVKSFKYDSVTSKDFKLSDINLVKQGLALVPKNGGTAWPFFTFPIETAGKTGTAEFGDPKNKTHAWYTAYAPINDPKIAITVLVEAGGEGSTVASPVAKELFRYYFSPDKNNLIKDLYPIATESAKVLGE